MSNAFLKHWLHDRSLSPPMKLLAILSTFDAPVALGEILSRREAAGIKRRAWSNPSSTLARSQGKAIHTDGKWEITRRGREALSAAGVVGEKGEAMTLAADLRDHLSRVQNASVKSYMIEAIGCLENGLLRSAVVMSWLAAIHVLHVEVLTSHLRAFNDAQGKIDKKWKPVTSTDDFGKLKESEFLDRLVSIGVLGKNVKASLKECLDRRNACGHPNSYMLGERTTAAHIETLILNIFERFSN